MNIEAFSLSLILVIICIAIGYFLVPFSLKAIIKGEFGVRKIDFKKLSLWQAFMLGGDRDYSGQYPFLNRLMGLMFLILYLLFLSLGILGLIRSFTLLW